MVLRGLLLLLFALAAFAASPPQRIVSTTPSITEILFALGLGDRVAGVTQYCRYPAEAQKLPKIGTYIQPNIEAIAALKPDLVVIQKNPIQLAAQLERVKLRVAELEYDSVPQTYAAIERLAEAAGVPERGRELSAKLRGQLEVIRARTAKLPPRKIMFVIGRNPGVIEGLIVVGRASYLTDLMEIAGGRNAFPDAVASYPKVTMEEIMARDPDVIVDMGDMSNTGGVTGAQKRKVVALWDRFGVLRAVRTKRVFAVADDYYVVPGPRMVEAVRSFARMLHPEAGL
jgi:iron complex transport system substrate-binding protein